MATDRFGSYLFAGTFLALAIGLSSAALQYQKAQVEAFQQEARGTLQSINDVKIGQVTNWREGLFADASFLTADMKLIVPIQKLAAGSASDSDRQLVKEWLEFLLKKHPYVNAIIADTDGRTRMAAGEHLANSAHYHQLVSQAMEIKRPLLTDLHADAGLTKLHMGLTIPIEGQQGPTNCALLLGIDPEQKLYPILNWWPNDWKSAETLLLEQEGDAAVYLSQPRDSRVSLIGQRVPATDQERTAIRAVKERAGYADGVDYRRQRVMAVARVVPGSSWIVETKIDRSEADAHAKGSVHLLAYAAVALIVAMGMALALLWRIVRRRGEKPLRETRAMLETIIQSSPAAIIAVDDKLRVTLWNPAAEQLFGWSAAEVLNQPLPKSPATTGSDFEALLDRLLSETIVDQAIVQYRKNGTPVPVKVSSSPIRSDQGEVAGAMAICIDATEQWEAENALRQSEQHFRELVEGAPVGIIVETRARFRYLNRAALEIFHAPDAEALLGRPIVGRVHPDDCATTEQRLRAVSEDQQPAPLAEMKYLRLDGTPIDVEICSIPTVYEGEPGGIGFFRDITARKVAEREKVLLEEQFRQAQKMEGIGRLAGSIAHDFNNHLTVISGYSQILFDDPDVNEDIRAMLSEIRAAGERAGHLTLQLLAFSRKQLIEPKVVDLNEVIRTSERMFRTLVGEDVGFHLILEPDLAPILADGGQLNQVLMNLLVNARDAMPEGGNLIVETANVDVDAAYAARHSGMKPGPHVVLTVTDTGIGMDEETQKHIFEPFFTSKKETGTGLGLATVFGVVHQMAGTIIVFSEPDKGATFKLYFPSTTEAPGSETRKQDSGQLLKGSERILLVEDSEQLRKFAVIVLSSAGYCVLEASNGMEALSIYELEQAKERIDLVITDVVMPEMNGRQLAEALWTKDPALPVLYTSGYTAAIIAKFGLLDPNIRYLPKPFSPAELLRKVRGIFDERVTRRFQVLLVDDEESVRRFLRTILEANGYDVREAANGKEAIALMKQQPADLVITDLVMPDQEGIETISEVRKLWPKVSVIAISGAFGGGFLNAARLMGARRTLLKPISPEDLLTAVHDVLEASPCA